MRLPRVRPIARKRAPTDALFAPPDLPDVVRPLHPRPGFEFPLRDGRHVFLSPVFPQDRPRLEAAFEQLSDRSRLYRFFRPRAHLTDDELREFTEVDQHDHVAWCALDAPDPPFDGLGIARMIRDRSDPAAAEVAVTVLDAWQRLGLGTVLLGLIVLRARALGIERLHAFVLPDNLVVVRWLIGLGWSIEGDDGCLEFAFPTTIEPSAEAAALGRFERLLDELGVSLGRCLSPDEDAPSAGSEAGPGPSP